MEVEDATLHFGPVEGFVCGVLLVESMAGNVFLDWGQEFGGFNGVGEEERGAETDEDGEEPFYDEDPAPAL